MIQSDKHLMLSHFWKSAVLGRFQPQKRRRPLGHKHPKGFYGGLCGARTHDIMVVKFDSRMALYQGFHMKQHRYFLYFFFISLDYPSLKLYNSSEIKEIHFPNIDENLIRGRALTPRCFCYIRFTASSLSWSSIFV